MKARFDYSKLSSHGPNFLVDSSWGQGTVCGLLNHGISGGQEHGMHMVVSELQPLAEESMTYGLSLQVITHARGRRGGEYERCAKGKGRGGEGGGVVEGLGIVTASAMGSGGGIDQA